MTRAPRRRAFVLALLVVVSTVFPVRHSDALGFFLIPLVMGMTTTSMMGVSAYCEMESCFSGGDQIGKSVAALGLQETKDGAPVNVTLRIPTTDDSAAQNTAMPAPSAAATADAVVTRRWYGLGGTYSYESAQAGCTSSISAQSGRSCLCDEQSGECLMFSDGVQDGGGIWLSITTSTPPKGYSNCVGGTCSLVSPRLATPDQKNDVARTSQGFTSGASVDSDAGSGLSVAGGGSSSPAPKVSVVGKNSKGEPLLLEVTRNSDASTQVKISTQSDQGGQSVIKETNVAISPDSVISSVASKVTAGSLTGLDTGTPSAVTDPGQQLNTSFPSDYARSGEAATAANSIKTSIDGVKDKLTNSEEVGDPTVPDWADGWTSTFNPLKSWSMAGHASVCPTGGFSWNGSAYYIDSHCQLFADHWSSLQTASIVSWTILALFIVLGA